MNILWIGPYFSDKAVAEKRSVNQAAAKWSRGLLDGLAANGRGVYVVSHITEQLWPKGRVVWQNNRKEWFGGDYPCERVGYLNVPFVKDIWLSCAYRIAVRRIMKRVKIDVVFCYNVFHKCNLAALREARKRGARVVPVVLDAGARMPDVDGWKTLMKQTSFADGVVFLSYWTYVNFPNVGMPRLHMDGGCVTFKGEPPDERKDQKPYDLVYTGALDRTRGLGFLVEVIKLCKRQDVRFTLCGKCNAASVSALFVDDPRVLVKGFVSNEELESILRKADVFINMRDPAVDLNKGNYPSKIPNYLAWGKPIVSTWLESFSPDYRDVLCIAEGNTPTAFAQKIDEVVNWDDQRRREYFYWIQKWFMAGKTWSVQARRLIEFARGLHG